MTEPSDRYTWRDFLVDLERLGCRAAAGAGAPKIVREMADGRVLSVSITPRRLEDPVFASTIEYVCTRLELDETLFLG